MPAFALAECYASAGELASAWTVFRAVADAALRERTGERAAVAIRRATDLAPRLPLLLAEVPLGGPPRPFDDSRRGDEPIVRWRTPVASLTLAAVMIALRTVHAENTDVNHGDGIACDAAGSCKLTFGQACQKNGDCLSGRCMAQICESTRADPLVAGAALAQDVALPPASSYIAGSSLR